MYIRSGSSIIYFISPWRKDSVLRTINYNINHDELESFLRGRTVTLWTQVRMIFIINATLLQDKSTAFYRWRLVWSYRTTLGMTKLGWLSETSPIIFPIISHIIYWLSSFSAHPSFLSLCWKAASRYENRCNLLAVLRAFLSRPDLLRVRGSCQWLWWADIRAPVAYEPQDFQTWSTQSRLRTSGKNM